MPRALVLALIGLLCLIWGSTWLVIRKGLEELPPFSAAACRFALAYFVMALLAPRLARREGGSPPDLKLVVVLGSLNFGCSYGIVYWSETRLPSGLVSVLWSTFPMMQAALAHGWLPGERLVSRQWIGLACGLVGVSLLFLTDLRGLGPAAVPAGLILLVSPLISAFGTLWVKRHGAATSSVLLNRNAMGVGALCLALAALATERDQDIVLGPAALGSIVYLAIAGTVVTFGVYFWLLRYAAAWLLSLIAYVTPLFALWLGATLGAEPVGVFTLAGTATILVGVALVLIGRRRPTSQPGAAVRVPHAADCGEGACRA